MGEPNEGVAPKAVVLPNAGGLPKAGALPNPKKPCWPVGWNGLPPLDGDPNPPAVGVPKADVLPNELGAPKAVWPPTALPPPNIDGPVDGLPKLVPPKSDPPDGGLEVVAAPNKPVGGFVGVPNADAGCVLVGVACCPNGELLPPNGFGGVEAAALLKSEEPNVDDGADEAGEGDPNVSEAPKAVGEVAPMPGVAATDDPKTLL